MKVVSMSAPEIDEQDIAAVVEVLRSGRLALGPAAEAFESEIAEYVGVRHAIAVSSGTAALHLVARALGIGPGDEVIVPSFTFAASVNAILYVGAKPVFADIEEDTYNLDPQDVKRRITSRTRAILAVDVFGHPVEWDEILTLADRYGLLVIDDACEALGAEYRGRKVGQFGSAATFAFYPNKQITTGEGGMIVTNDDRIARVCRSLRNQGRSEDGSWLFHRHLGYNYRMDEMSAALGRSQLRRIESFLEKRQRVADLYTERIVRLPFVRPPVIRSHVRMSWFVYVITLTADIDRNKLMKCMAAQGVQTRGYFEPIHKQPYIRELGIDGGDLPVTESVAQRTIALPFHNNMSAEDVEYVVEALTTAVEAVVG
ncbi:DegT/DnrJ/EryC1/StrS family aminotransferase [Thermaerobacter sp. PB12/4term]|uniref:DegT/DnrJ/EryC1/StrS family aminotransferase n=1 Tax=Thermaerobacter sp. PB12/4term TaxID=2293838 RepID=UPI000E3279A2|nr:DegT/DnrJ/EryC1/StrS family aminotransferase [Thermaerobacter sp. PB12/4term]QIA28187.1 DegT/DnrJ/EryC1/StrS family aminotransferase [Thermaerobacter sp. PB12/4term]